MAAEAISEKATNADEVPRSSLVPLVGVADAELSQDPKTGASSSVVEDWPDDSWWSACRAQIKADEKTLMAHYFVGHHFLVREGQNPESARETVASVVVNQGTTPNRVIDGCLHWIEQHQAHGPFFLTWYTPGHLIPTTLRSFRDKNRRLRTAAKLFLFPGEVDDETESVSGPDAENFAEHLQRRFTYSFLSAYSFDVCTGSVYFHLPREVRLQKACAKLFAAHKFLFFDSSKFKSEGEAGYTIVDLLQSAYTVTIYTVCTNSNKNDDWIEAKFRQLCKQALREIPSDITDESERKTLRLQIVGRGTCRSRCVEVQGVLRSS